MNGYEKRLIDEYIVSTKKSRLTYELNSTKKRHDFIMRFCHDSKKYIEQKRIICYGDLKNTLSMITAKENYRVFVISDLYPDGIMMNFNDMILYLENEYMSVIAITDSCALIKEESDSKSYAYLLK